MLQSVDKTTKSQVILQHTVEGLSVIVIAYYVAGLGGYIFKGLQEMGWLQAMPISPRRCSFPSPSAWLSASRPSARSMLHKKLSREQQSYAIGCGLKDENRTAVIRETFRHAFEPRIARVWEASHFAIAPVCLPPRCDRLPGPPSGPRSITQSADLITSRLCSTTTSVLPAFTKFMQHGKELLDIIEVETGGRFVHDVEEVLCAGIFQLGRDFQPLGFAA